MFILIHAFTLKKAYDKEGEYTAAAAAPNNIQIGNETGTIHMHIAYMWMLMWCYLNERSSFLPTILSLSLSPYVNVCTNMIWCFIAPVRARSFSLSVNKSLFVCSFLLTSPSDAKFVYSRSHSTTLILCVYFMFIHSKLVLLMCCAWVILCVCKRAYISTTNRTHTKCDYDRIDQENERNMW